MKTKNQYISKRKVLKSTLLGGEGEKEGQGGRESKQEIEK